MFIELLSDAAVTLGKTVVEDCGGAWFVARLQEGVDTPELHRHITHPLY